MKPNHLPAADGGLANELAAESALIERFVGLLKTEQRALKEGMVDSLEQLAREKSVMVTELRNRQARREREAGNTGVEAWVTRKGGAAAARGWRDLLAIAREAHRLNHINGILIDTLMRNNRRALAILQGVAQRANLYGPDGRTEHYTGGRMLGAV
jgi:flagellar biosynthesis/type III secretory pathway chaperone